MVIGQDCVEPLQALKSASKEVMLQFYGLHFFPCAINALLKLLVHREL